MKIKIYSFFSGAGFLDLGFEDEGFNICFVNEYNKNFLDAYKYAREKMKYSKPIHGYFQDDINLLLKKPSNIILSQYINNDKKTSLIGFIGGPPCPDFSIAGKNNGISGVNGKLTNSYKRLIIKHQPDFFLFENVKGLWNTKKHREYYEKFKDAFKRKGYVLEEKLVNALEYGVPQDRERILLFGIKYNLVSNEKKQAQKILKSNFIWGNTKYNIQQIKNINWPTTDDFVSNNDRNIPNNIIEQLTVEYWFRRNDVLTHINAKDYFLPKSIHRFETICEGDVSKKSFKRLHRWRFSPTVAYGNNEVHLHPYKTRRLSVSEALALQSLPKEFVICPKLTLSNKFKTVGNGVPYLLSKEVAYQIKVFLQNNCINNRGENNVISDRDNKV